MEAKAVALIKEIKIIGDNGDYNQLSFVGGNKEVYSFKNFKTLKKLIKYLHNRNITIGEAEIKQNKFAEELDKLRAYPARESTHPVHDVPGYPKNPAHDVPYSGPIGDSWGTNTKTDD